MAAVGKPPEGRRSDKDPSEIQRASADGLSHGITIAVSVALFLWLGDLLDQRIGGVLGVATAAPTGDDDLLDALLELLLEQREEARLAAEKDRETREGEGS